MVDEHGGHWAEIQSSTLFCNICNNPIRPGMRYIERIRGTLDNKGMMYGPLYRWYHEECYDNNMPNGNKKKSWWQRS